MYIDGDRGQVWGVVPETCCGISWIGRPAGEVQSVGRLAFQSLCAPQCMQSCTVGILYVLLVPSFMWWFMHIIQWMQVLLCCHNVEGLNSKTSLIWAPIFLVVKGPIIYPMIWLASFTNYAQLSSILKHCHSHYPTTSRVMWYSLSDHNGYTCVVLVQVLCTHASWPILDTHMFTVRLYLWWTWAYCIIDIDLLRNGSNCLRLQEWLEKWFNIPPLYMILNNQTKSSLWWFM